MNLIFKKFGLILTLSLIVMTNNCSSEPIDEDPSSSEFDTYSRTGGGQPAPEDALANTWFQLTTENAPSQDRFHYEVITIDEEISLWGGSTTPDGSTFHSTISVLNFMENEWSSIESPTTVTDHQKAIVTEDEIITYGGFSGISGQRYEFDKETFQNLTTGTKNTDSDRGFVVWTGEDLVVWGGWIGGTSGSADATGAIWNLENDTWSSMVTTDAALITSATFGTEIGRQAYTYHHIGSVITVLTDAGTQTTQVQAYDLVDTSWSELADEDNFYILSDLGESEEGVRIYLAARREIDEVDEDEIDTLQRTIVELDLATMDFTEMDDLPDLGSASHGVVGNDGIYLHIEGSFGHLSLSDLTLTLLPDAGKPNDLTIEKMLWEKGKLIVLGKDSSSQTFSGSVYTP